MPLSSAELSQIERVTKDRRNAAARERHANALTYRKVPERVTFIETAGPDGTTLLLANSNARSEIGRWFQLIRRPDGKWTCTCGLFRNCGSCAHAGAAAARDDQTRDERNLAR